MSGLLFLVGAIVAAAGVGMIGYGIPVHEFSFGNTLIVAGTTATVGGLLMIGIGAAVGQLRRIARTLAAHPEQHSGRPLEMFEPPAGSHVAPASGRTPFPPGSQAEPSGREPRRPTESPAPEDHAGAAVAPMLRNPARPAGLVDEFEIKDYEAVSLSPQQSRRSPPPLDLDEPVPQRSGSNPPAGTEPGFDTPWQFAPPQPPQTGHFNATWSSGSRPTKRSAGDEPKPEPKLDRAPGPVPEAPGKSIAILKSGVVDGMGYTLYIDGSIEAVLPQGTLHFASINELRDHLAKH